jgi:DNA mismatch repair ATPase MutS
MLAALRGPQEPFVPNDIELGVLNPSQGSNPVVHLITGPNMAGKSTLMRK